MCIRHVEFLLLIWFPGVLHAQSAAQPCPALKLDHGYFVPEEETYSNDTKLFYACNKGLKPVVEGWWATSTCQNGTWSHKPQCIDQNDCIEPLIPNAKYDHEQKGWYSEGYTISITCHKGYEPKDQQATTCTNGTWSSLPVCKKSLQACNVPPKIPHAVITNQRYRNVFDVDTRVQYKCEDGYTAEGDLTLYCLTGNWSIDSQRCVKGTRPSAGRDESTAGGAGGGHTSSADRVTQPAGGDLDRGTSTGTRESGSAVEGTGGRATTFAGSGTSPAGRETRPDTEHDRRTQPAGGGSSTNSGLSERESGPLITPIDYCGKHPVVPNSVIVETSRMFLKYKCTAFHTQVGSETVTCYNDGTWSQLPVCKEAFCIIKPEQFVGRNLQLSGVEYMEEGARKNVPCIWYSYSSWFQCTNGKISVTNCCYYADHSAGRCQKVPQLFG